MGDISLMYLLQLAWKRLPILALALFLAASVAFGYCNFFAKPAYTSTASILVTNGAIVTQYESSDGKDEYDSISGTDISASLSLANTVTDILETPDVYVRLAAQLQDKYSYSQLQGMTTVQRRANDTLFIDITFRSTDGDEAKHIANEFAKISCEYVTEYIPYAKARVVSSAMKYVKVYPRTIFITAIAGLLGAVLTFAICFCIDFFNQSIRGEDEFVSKYDIPLIGSVPDFENSEVVGSYYNYGKKGGYTYGK